MGFLLLHAGYDKIRSNKAKYCPQFDVPHKEMGIVVTILRLMYPLEALLYIFINYTVNYLPSPLEGII